MSKIYAAYKLSEIEYDLLACLVDEDNPSSVTIQWLWENYGLLEDYATQQLQDAANSLAAKNMLSRLLPDGLFLTPTQYGRDVMEWKENTSREIDTL